MNFPFDIPYNIILGSKSPRRKDLLQQLQIEFKVQSIETEEIVPTTINVIDVPEYLAKLKGDAFKSLLKTNDLVITADTIVLHDQEVLGKPIDSKEAKEMISRLAGKKHEVITGVSLLTSDFEHSFHETTIVEFEDFSPNEIDFYVEHFKPYDKAGAYGIQEWIGLIGVKKIEGCFFNVIGLPVPRLYKELKSLLQTD